MSYGQAILVEVAGGAHVRVHLHQLGLTATGRPIYHVVTCEFLCNQAIDRFLCRP